jgi:hypothetical protein
VGWNGGRRRLDFHENESGTTIGVVKPSVRWPRRWVRRGVRRFALAEIILAIVGRGGSRIVERRLDVGVFKPSGRSVYVFDGDDVFRAAVIVKNHVGAKTNFLQSL